LNGGYEEKENSKIKEKKKKGKYCETNLRNLERGRNEA
jgi:hypothetical protein